MGSVKIFFWQAVAKEESLKEVNQRRENQRRENLLAVASIFSDGGEDIEVGDIEVEDIGKSCVEKELSKRREKIRLFKEREERKRNFFMVLSLLIYGIMVGFAIAAILTAAILIFVVLPYFIIKGVLFYKRTSRYFNIGLM